MHLCLFRCRFTFALGLLGVFLAAGCSSEPKPKTFAPPPTRGLVWKVLHPFARGTESTGKKSGLVVTIEADSTTPSLAAVRQLGVRILVTNYTKTLLSLSFPDGQRIEILGRSSDGKIFYDYKTDRIFTAEKGVLSINPGEHLEYTEAIPTKNMTPGKTYLITASLVGRADVKSTLSITAQP